jgi:hypothetical protein
MNRLLITLLAFLPLTFFVACDTSGGEEEETTEEVTAEAVYEACIACTEAGDSDDIEECVKGVADEYGEALEGNDDLLDELHDMLVSFYVETECNCYDEGDVDDITDCIDEMWEWDYTLVGALDYENIVDEDDFWDDYYDDLYDQCEDEKYAYEDEYYGYEDEWSDVEYAAEELCLCMEDYMDGYIDAEEMDECLLDVEDWYGADIIDEAYEWWYVEDYCPDAYEYVMGE